MHLVFVGFENYVISNFMFFFAENAPGMIGDPQQKN